MSGSASLEDAAAVAAARHDAAAFSVAVASAAFDAVATSSISTSTSSPPPSTASFIAHLTTLPVTVTSPASISGETCALTTRGTYPRLSPSTAAFPFPSASKHRSARASAGLSRSRAIVSAAPTGVVNGLIFFAVPVAAASISDPE